jgi:hypothetical protein
MMPAVTIGNTGIVLIVIFPCMHELQQQSSYAWIDFLKCRLALHRGHFLQYAAQVLQGLA